MATSSLVPGSALLLTTSTSSTRPVAKKPSMVARIEPRSAYVIRITETLFPCHIPFPPRTRSVQMWDQTAHDALCDESPEPSRLSESLATGCAPGSSHVERKAAGRLVQSAACETASASMPRGSVTTKRVPPSVG